jgi:hypothetical protein
MKTSAGTQRMYHIPSAKTERHGPEKIEGERINNRCDAKAQSCSDWLKQR